MDGIEIFQFSIQEVPKTIKGFLQQIERTVNDFDYVLLHQANKLIVQTIAKKIKVSVEKVPLSLDRFGNTDGASIPVTLVDMKGRGIFAGKKKTKILASGFGIGLSWGVNAFEIDADDILPLIETDDYFKEAC